jgi:hypothetical protein
MGALQNCWAGQFRILENEYVTVGAHSAFNFQPGLNSWSMQAWIKTGAAGNGSYMVVAKGFKNVCQYGFSINAIDLDVYIGGEIFNYNIGGLLGIVLNDAEWHHIVISFSASQLWVFVDGQQAATNAYTGTTMQAADVLIGAVRSTTLFDSETEFDGWIDEVGIWSTTLSFAQAVALYNGADGLMLDDDSGSYTKSAFLEGWWRMGDGSTEHAGGVPTALIADESGNGRNGTFNSDSIDLSLFYWGGDSVVRPVPGFSYCVFFLSSSSLTPAIVPSFTVERLDQGNLRDKVGFEGSLFRMLIACTSTSGVINKIFVHEISRPYPGITLRKRVFRRVADINDLTLIPEDTPRPQFPFAFRTSQAEIFAPTTALLDRAWKEIQQQCATLSLDMVEFGVPVVGRGAVLRGGAGVAAFVDSETFTAPEPIEVESSSVAPVFGPSSSSSSFSAVPPPLALSSSSLAPVSSSSDWVDPDLFSVLIYLEHTKDAATRFNQHGTQTVFNDLGFIRFGRNLDPGEYWDAFLRFPLAIPRCAHILSAALLLTAHTSETGEDAVLRVRDIYKPGYLPVDQFSGVDDPAVARNGVIWDRLAATIQNGVVSLPPNITAMMQFFVDRWHYDPDGGNEYFGLWIQEVVSDPGARRDGSISLLAPALVVSYRTDSVCSSSSAGG